MRVGLLVVALVAGAAASASAQNRRWADPYNNGVKAFESGKCSDAIPQFERAVAADPKAGANKRVEGVFGIDYFPYYYLAQCYAQLQQWDKASQNLEKARPTLTRQQQATFTETENRVKAALSAANAPRVDPRKAAFDAAVAQAESSLSGRQFDQAIRQFDAIKGSYASEYASAGLAAKRDEASRGHAGQLFDEGRTLAGSQKYGEARAKFQQAEQAFPGQRQVADALADIKKREDDYQQLKGQAIADQNARNFAGAKDKFEQARTRDAELFAADNLGARLNDVTTQLSRNRDTAPDPGGTVDPKAQQIQTLTKSAKDYLTQGKYAEAETAYGSVLKLDPKNREATDAMAKATQFKELRDRSARLAKSKNTSAAQQALADARRVDPERFTREGLGAILDKLAPPPSPGVPAADLTRAALQQGLTALLNGRTEESIAILEPASTKSAGSASLHAYLGVAYATQALSAPKPEDRSRLQDKALDQFKLAKTAEAGYQLSGRIVSPAIVSIYQNARP